MMKDKKHKFWNGIWSFTHKDRFGNILSEWTKENALADEGALLLLDTVFRGQNIPDTFYVRLFNDTPVETDSLTDLTGEPVGNGYNALALNVNTTDFPTLEIVEGDAQVTCKSVTFLASGGRIPVAGEVTHLVLATSADNTGKLISFVSLSEARYLEDKESLTVSYTIKLQ